MAVRRARGVMPILVLVLVLVLGATPLVAALAQFPARAAAVPSAPTGPAVAVAASVALPGEGRVPRDLAPLASLVLPGAGQAVLGKDRFLAFVALEAFAWLQWRKDALEGGRERRRYRALARDVARASFGGPRPDGRWAYYEDMERYLESGQFSLSAAALIPEPDTLTFNGSRWLLARRTYWTNPDVPPPATSAEYQRALQFYEGEAVRPEYRWSWRNAQLQWDLFRQSIDRANDSARRARAATTILIANHLLSAVDAFATVRVERGVRDGRTEHRVRVSVPFGP